MSRVIQNPGNVERLLTKHVNKVADLTSGRVGFTAIDQMTVTIKDGFWMLTIRKGQAFIPTMARTEAGFYIGIDPVEVVDASDRKAVEDAMLRAIGRGNPTVPTPTRDNFPEDVLLKYARVKSLSAFEKLAQTWKFSKRQGAYLIAPYRPLKSGGSEEDKERMEAIPTEESLETAVRRLITRAARAAGVFKR